MTEQAVKDWISKQKASKAKWISREFGESRDKFEENSYQKVIGKLAFIEELEKQIRKVEKQGK